MLRKAPLQRENIEEKRTALVINRYQNHTLLDTRL